ncbi:MAG: DUF1850 domain-containing protein [Alkalilacustris sp.]
MTEGAAPRRSCVVAAPARAVALGCAVAVAAAITAGAGPVAAPAAGPGTGPVSATTGPAGPGASRDGATSRREVGEADTDARATDPRAAGQRATGHAHTGHSHTGHFHRGQFAMGDGTMGQGDRDRPAPARSGPVLEVRPVRGGVSGREAPGSEPIGALPMSEGTEICLHWSHSVTGGDVIDCFENRGGRLTLVRSFLHDFAAGLGTVEGRGTLEPAAGGGYWITGIDEALPHDRLTLRVGRARVGHRLVGPDGILALSELAPGTLVSLTLAPPTR